MWHCLERLEERVVLSATWVTITPQVLPDETSYQGFVTSNAGRVTGVSVDPTDNNTIFTAAAGGGVWKTTDSGNTWAPQTDHVTDGNGKPVVMFMGAIAETRDANSHEIVYAGTGEANNSGDNYYGEGILVSTDGGTSWTLENAGGAFTGLSTAKIAIDPSDPTGKTAYAAMADNGQAGFAVPIASLNASSNTGIWKTTNGGVTWTNTTASINNTDSWSDVVIDRHTPTTLYAALGNSTGGANNGVYKSTNGGATWNLLANGPTGSTVGRITLALFDNGTTNELFVSVSTTTGSPKPLKMLKSLNGGTSFTDLTTNVLAVGNYLGTQGDYDTTLAIDPLDANFIYASGDQDPSGTPAGNVESFDGGTTWHAIQTAGSATPASEPHTDAHAVAFDANGNLLEGNDGGLFRLNNPTNPPQLANQSWIALNGNATTGNLNTLQFFSVGVDPTTPTTAYGGVQDQGSLKVTAGVLSFELGGDGAISAVDPNHPNIVYGHVSDTLQVSTDSGATFNDITPAGAAGSAFLPPFTVDSSSNIYYSGAGNKLFFSSNNGTTWTAIGTATNGFTPAAGSVTNIAVSPINNNIIYVASAGSIFVTHNAQAGAANVTWTTVSFPNTVGGQANNAPNLLAVDPSVNTGGTVYAVIDTFTGLTGGGSHHVYKSTNFGTSWSDITGNLQDVPVRSVAVSTDGQTIFIGTDVGVYSSTNGGTTWAQFGTGLPNVQVTGLEVVPGHNILAAATHGRGLWEVPTTPGVPATLSGFSGTQTYISGSAPIAVAPNLIVTDSNSATLASATVAFTNWQAEDRLAFSNSFALQHTFTMDSVHHTAMLTLTGVATLAKYQTTLRSIVYSDPAGNPIKTGRGVSITVNDGSTDSNTVTGTINVSKLNHAPIGTSTTVAAIANTAYVIKTTDFGFTDPNDAPHNALLAVKFSLLPTAGTLTDNGVAVTLNQFVSAADISGGKLTFTPQANLLGGPFFLCKFQVQDDGGTAGGGLNLDSSAKVLDVNLSRLNHAPSGTSNTVTTSVNVAYTLKTADFGFTDPNDSPPNAFMAVKINLLPSAGTLTDNGAPVTLNQFVSATDISSGKLIFQPNANLTGGPFFLCRFQVQDNGGTAVGGVNLDPTAKVLDIRILP